MSKGHAVTPILPAIMVGSLSSTKCATKRSLVQFTTRNRIAFSMVKLMKIQEIEGLQRLVSLRQLMSVLSSTYPTAVAEICTSTTIMEALQLLREAATSVVTKSHSLTL